MAARKAYKTLGVVACAAVIVQPFVLVSWAPKVSPQYFTWAARTLDQASSLATTRYVAST